MTTDDYHTRLSAVHARLSAWLLNEAYPRWLTHGVNHSTGGFVEAIERDGAVLAQALRARVQARQLFALACAPELGWTGDVQNLMLRALNFMVARFRRKDGLFRCLIDADGGVLDDRPLLYDQSFVLLSYAAAAAALNAREEFETHALALRATLEHCLRAPDGTFFSSLEHTVVRETNPHMHLLEACLAWAEIGNDATWRVWARDLIDIALARFIRSDSGALGESYTAAGRPASGIAGRVIEPGHQFEWGWLLLRAELKHAVPVRAAALRLIGNAEQFGIFEGFAVNALLDDFSMHDSNARLWPQTERLKAALSAAVTTGDARAWSTACDAAESLFAYFNPQTSGLWFDIRMADGSMPATSAPASTLYHVVGAIMALQRTLRVACAP